MILYINACVRKESRTNFIAKELLSVLGEYTELALEKECPAPLNEETLALRTKLIYERNYSHPMFAYAKQFAEADVIVISAPFWDLSFPAILKIYLENIYVTGITSRYGEEGIPQGLCKAKKLYYVTTAGGPYIPVFGYEYVKSLAVNCFGIKETKLICAENLDIFGADEKRIIDDAVKELNGISGKDE